MNNGLSIDYKASPTLADFHRDDSFFRGIRGPVGSGKTIGTLMDMFMRTLQQRPNKQGFRKSRVLVVRASYPELRSTVIKSFQDWFPDHLCPLKMNEAPISGLMQMPLPDRTILHAEWLFVALDRPKDLAKLLSLEITMAALAEAKELTKEVVDTVTSRVGRYPSQRDGGPSWFGVVADTNSPSTTHWWKRLEEEPPNNWKFYRQPPAMFKDEDGEYELNPKAENLPNLPKGYYENAIGGKPSSWISAYVLNRFAATQIGRPVYGDMWNEQTHIARLPLVPMDGHPVLCSLDFGLTPAALLTQHIDGQLRVVDEITSKRMGLEQFLTMELLPLIGQRYFEHEVSFVGDPSGVKGSDTNAKSCFDVLQKFGLPAVPAHSNALEPRLGAVRHYLTKLVANGKPALLVSPSCQALINGFNGEYQYGRMQVSGEERYREVPEKNHASHVHDCLQYAAMRWQVLGKRQLFMQTGSKPWTPADSVTGY